MKTLPPLTWFRSFEAAARTQSTTAAAAEVGLTQSAVSQQIKALETRLGVALFKRHARGLALTDDGRRLLPKVEAALSDLTAAVAPFDHVPAPSNLTIAASVSVIEWVLAPALPDFRRRHPDVSLQFVGTIWPDEYAQARADIEIRFGSERQVGQGAVALPGQTLVAVKHPALAGDVQDLSLIETVGTSNGWAAWAKAAGVGPRAPDLAVDTYGVAMRFAQTGNGVALVHRLIAARAIADGSAVIAHPHAIPGIEGYFLSVRSQTNAAMAFRRWLDQQIDGFGLA